MHAPPCLFAIRRNHIICFNYDTWTAIGGRSTLLITPNDDAKADRDSLFRLPKSFCVAFKAAVSTENRETSVSDRSRPYPDGLCCNCIHILLTEPYFSSQWKTQHDKSRHNTMSTTIMAVFFRVTMCLNLVQWQTVAGLPRILKWVTRAGKKRCYYTLLVYKLFLQRTYSDTHVYLRFK